MSEKSALVTGGAVRLGREFVKALADEGYSIAIHYYKSEDEAEELRLSLESSGVKAVSYKADLMRSDSAQDLIARVIHDFPFLDTLVNSASVFEKEGFSGISRANLERNFSLHLYAPVIIARGFVGMTKSKSGSIVNVLDTRITSDRTTRPGYSLSKKALAEFTRMAALEYAPAFTVNGIAPGIIGAFEGMDEAGVAGNNPMKRSVSLKSVVRTLLFLLNNRDITGNIIYPDCGSSLFE